MHVLQTSTTWGPRQMSATGMMAPQPYYQGQGTAFNRIVKRPLTDAERQFAVGSYKMLQNGLRAIAIVSLVFFVLYTFVISGLVIDETFSLVFSMIMIAIGAVALGMSLNTLVMRKKISDAMRDGMAIEVQGPAYKSRAMKNVPSWTVGPISLMATREMESLIQEGAQVSVLCIPRLKLALAINNYGLKRGVRAIFPPNLEAMAVPADQVAVPSAGRPTQTAYPQYGSSIPQGQPTRTPYPEEDLPPPPPPDF
jgi:hypothetical protein